MGDRASKASVDDISKCNEFIQEWLALYKVITLTKLIMTFQALYYTTRPAVQSKAKLYDVIEEIKMQ